EALLKECREDYRSMGDAIFWVRSERGAKWAIFIQTNCLPGTDAHATLCSAAVGGALQVVLGQGNLFDLKLETIQTGVKEKKINLLSDRAAFALLRRLDEYLMTIGWEVAPHRMGFGIHKEPEYFIITLIWDFRNQGRKNVVAKPPSSDDDS
ncbi:hypothetical protein PMAYCL1PPCAC_11824, partial [Pristionchus mayeri]